MQRILYGIENLSAAVSGCRRVLLVCDGAFSHLSIRGTVEAIPSIVARFDRFASNPLYEDVMNGVWLFNDLQCDALLAVGGGSAIDVAKCIKLYCRMSLDELCFEQEYSDTGINLIAIPTTAGTGSESTRFAVIYYEGRKLSVTHSSIIPNIAILEPSVLATLPLYQKKCTMLDALCQGIESWWSIHSTEESRQLSHSAVNAIMTWWEPYIFDNSTTAAARIMAAANTAGQAICITQTTAPHAFSYKLTSLYGLPHGHAVAVSMATIWQYMLDHEELCIDGRGRAYLQDVFEQIARGMGAADAVAAREKFVMMLNKLEVFPPTPIHRDEELDVLTSSVNPIRLNNNPISLSTSAIRTIYDRILQSTVE